MGGDGGRDVVSDRKSSGRQFWDANPCGGDWTSYRQFLDWYGQTEPYLSHVLDRESWGGCRVLEVGCGQGVVLHALVERGAVAIGLDVSQASLRRAAGGACEIGRAVRLVQGDAEGLPFSDAMFDAVVSFGVLHHTPDTERAINELRRVLRPGGVAIVMLYRSGNPKWIATRIARGASSVVRWASRISGPALALLRCGHTVGDERGTALLELFGVPVLKAYSNREMSRLFEGMKAITVRNYQPGFLRLADVAPPLRPFKGLLRRIDAAAERRWGFYQVVRAVQPG